MWPRGDLGHQDPGAAAGHNLAAAACDQLLEKPGGERRADPRVAKRDRRVAGPHLVDGVFPHLATLLADAPRGTPVAQRGDSHPEKSRARNARGNPRTRSGGRGRMSASRSGSNSRIGASRCDNGAGLAGAGGRAGAAAPESEDVWESGDAPESRGTDSDSSMHGMVRRTRGRSQPRGGWVFVAWCIGLPAGLGRECFPLAMAPIRDKLLRSQEVVEGAAPSAPLLANLMSRLPPRTVPPGHTCQTKAGADGAAPSRRRVRVLGARKTAARKHLPRTVPVALAGQIRMRFSLPPRSVPRYFFSSFAAAVCPWPASPRSR